MTLPYRIIIGWFKYSLDSLRHSHAKNYSVAQHKYPHTCPILMYNFHIYAELLFTPRVYVPIRVVRYALKHYGILIAGNYSETTEPLIVQYYNKLKGRHFMSHEFDGMNIQMNDRAQSFQRDDFVQDAEPLKEYLEIMYQ